MSNTPSNYSDLLQKGVEAYLQWKENVNNENSSAYGGNLHDLAHRMFQAMNCDEQKA